MGNRLKRIFSNEPVEEQQRIEWSDSSSYENFMEAVNKAIAGGEWESVKGDLRGQHCVASGDNVFPISDEIAMHSVQIRQSPHIVEIPIQDQGNAVVNYYLGEGRVIIESADEITVLKIQLFQDDSAKVNYECHYEKAESAKHIANSLNRALAVLEYVFKEDDEATGKDAGHEITVKEFKNRFQNSYKIWRKIDALENILNLRFEIETLEMNNETIETVEELYYLLFEKKVIRLNAKLSDGKMEIVKKINTEKDVKVGDSISLAFVNKRAYDLVDKNICVYIVGYLSDASVKEIRYKNGEVREIIYGDSDSVPMYISYSGFLKEQEAQEEYERLNGAESIKDEYCQAKPLSEYIKNDFQP